MIKFIILIMALYVGIVFGQRNDEQRRVIVPYYLHQGVHTVTGNSIAQGDLTVDGATTFTGNSTFGGTVTLSGTATFNGGIVLGAGDDLIGSSTSDITFNTNKFTVAGATGNTLVAGTFDVTGKTTLTGELETNGNLNIDGALTLPTSPLVIYALGGAPGLITDGEDVAADDGDRHFSQIYVPYTTTVTGIFYLIGSVGGTDSVIVDLYDATGTLVPGGTSLTAGGDAEVLVGSAATIQAVPFEDGAITLNPGSYFVSVQFDGTTAKYAAYEVTGSLFIADTDAGTFGTAASLTPGTAYVDNEGMIGGIY